MESDSLASVSKGVTYFFKLVITINQKNQKKKKNNNQKNLSSLWKFYQTHSHNLHFGITGLEFNNRKILPDPLP